MKGLLPPQIGSDNNSIELFIEASRIRCRYVDSKMILYNFHCHALAVCRGSTDDGKACHNNESVAACSMAFHLSAVRNSCFDLRGRPYFSSGDALSRRQISHETNREKMDVAHQTIRDVSSLILGQTWGNHGTIMGPHEVFPEIE